jgi:hypothetical protein
MKQPCIVSRQSTCIVAVLDVAKRDFLVQFTPIGVHVETESLPGQEGVSCSGVSLRDALGQATQVLALELGIDIDAVVDGAAWTHDDPADPEERIPYSLEAPVEFCTRFVQLTLDDHEREAV